LVGRCPIGLGYFGNRSRPTFLADRTGTQIDRLLAESCRFSLCSSVCLSVCDAVHCGSQGWYTGLKVSVFLAGMFLFVPSDTFAVGCIV